MRVLADDAMEGREAGTPGYAMAVDHVTRRFAEIGLTPGGDAGGWEQRFTLARYGQAREMRLSVVDPGGNSRKAFGNIDFAGGGASAAGRGQVDAEMVFVGYGLDLPDRGYDDFAGVDLAGKVAVWVMGTPEGLDPLQATHLQQSFAERLGERGAVGAIMLWTPEMEAMAPWDRARGFFGGGSGVTWLGPDGVPSDSGHGLRFSAVASPRWAEELMAGQRLDLAAIAAAQADDMAPLQSFSMGLRLRADWAVEVEPRLQTSNVIGVLPGTDPALAGEYVVVTAHLDHVGITRERRPDGDRIFNGAMDNATGVATLLEAARLMAADPPRRPVMFVALGAEEMGLLGSSYHASHPGLAAGTLAANVNVDMPILTFPFSDVVAFGADFSNLLPEVARATDAYGLTLVPDPNPDEGFFFRSDQYSYVRQGIPSVYLDIGFGNGGDVAQPAFLERNYHQPSDEADLIAYEQLGRFADMAQAVVRNVANMAETPAWYADGWFAGTFGGPSVTRPAAE